MCACVCARAGTSVYTRSEIIYALVLHERILKYVRCAVASHLPCLLLLLLGLLGLLLVLLFFTGRPGRRLCDRG